MKLMKWLPGPLRRIVREKMTVYVYEYGFRPSTVVEEQALLFRYLGKPLTVKADFRTALYDMIAEVVDYDAYQLRQVEWKPGRDRHIVDIGANVGVTALVLSQIPGTKVVCYEPDPGNCALLRQNLALNEITNVKVLQAAVGGVDGTVEFQFDEESTGGHIVREGLGSKARTIKVNAVTLENALAPCESREIDLLKCDCEGGEYAIIEQMTPKLAARIRNLTLEVHNLDRVRNIERISAQLGNLGYQLSHKSDMWGRGALHMLLARQTG